MFDANAAHIKEGELFFAEIHGTDSQLESAGIKCGDIVLVSHCEKSISRPIDNLSSNIFTEKDGTPTKWLDYGSDEYSWMVYSGRPDGTDFISEKLKAKALEFLGGEWMIKDGEQ